MKLINSNVKMTTIDRVVFLISKNWPQKIYLHCAQNWGAAWASIFHGNILYMYLESVRPFARRGAQISLIAHIWVLQWIWLKILTKFSVNKIFLAKHLTKLWHFIGSTWNNIFIAYLSVFKVILSLILVISISSKSAFSFKITLHLSFPLILQTMLSVKILGPTKILV